MMNESYRDPTFDRVACREAAQQRHAAAVLCRLAREAELQRERDKMPNTLLWIKRLRIRALVRNAMNRKRI
ncbi:hypothetical protein GCM10027202_15660 [Microvirgula curvata]